MATSNRSGTAAPVSCSVGDARSGDRRSQAEIASRREAVFACGEIAALAYRLDREFYFGNDDPGPGDSDDRIPERTRLFLDRLREAIGRIGWLAEQVCPGTIREDAREWLLPPMYFVAAADFSEGGAA